MFDNNSFSRSELYFATLQLLRISSEWISGGMKDLENLAEAFGQFSLNLSLNRGSEGPSYYNTTKNVLRALDQNWKIVISHQKHDGDSLLGRITKKTEEVKTLRDGVRSNNPEARPIVYFSRLI